MKTFAMISAFAALLAMGCTTTTPNVSVGGSAIPLEPLKIKNMSPVTYEYKSVNEGCSEVDFLKQFVGNSMRIKGGIMQIDNVVDIRMKVVDSQTSFAVFKGDKEYACSFWGIAVEYVK